MAATAGMSDVGMGVRMLSRLVATSRFCRFVMPVIAVDDLGWDVVVEEPRDDLDSDESENEEHEKQPGRL